MRGDIYGTLGNVTKGEPGLSAYEVAVKNGFVGTEAEWLASLKANAAPAMAAAIEAKASATQAESAGNKAENFAEEAKRYMRGAADSEQSAYDSRTAAAASAREATTAAGSAAENAAYIAGRVNAAMTSADQAAVSESHAAASAGRAWQSEANAKQSELMAAEYYTHVRDASGAASASATEAAQSAERAANSAVQAATVISEFNANVELAHQYANIAGGYANNSQTYAVAAADAANRAEEALGNALAPLANYYTKAQTNEQITQAVAAEADARNVAETAINTAIADRYTKQEVDAIVMALPKMKRLVVESLPVTDIDPETIYMVPTTSRTGNVYTEYLYINDAWEELGTSEVELANYEKKSDIAPYKAKVDGMEAGAQVNRVTGVKGDSENTYRIGNVNITKANIGLENVDNTHDADKHVKEAERLHNVNTTSTYAVGDVVFDGALSPHMCYVCVTGSAGA